MPLQLFTSLVGSLKPGDIVGGSFFRWDSSNFVLSATDNALRCGSSSPASRTRDGNSMVSSRPSLGAAICGGTPGSTLIGSGATALRLRPGVRHSYPRNPFCPGRVAQKNGCLHTVALHFCQLHRIALQLHSAIPVQPGWRCCRDCCCRCCILIFTRNLLAICQICNGFARKCYLSVY